MKKMILSFIVFAFFANVSAQLKVNSLGQVGVGTTNPQYQLDVVGNTRVAGNILLDSVSNYLGTVTNAPLTFKVNNVLAGFTGYYWEDNVSFGFGSLLNPFAGNYNTAMGSSALRSNTAVGKYNTAIGSSALYFNTSGVVNTATGSCALYQNQTGSFNTADGCNALNPNTTGSYNTAVGYTALYGNTTGNYNTAIGYYAGAFNPDNLANTTTIGYGATATGSNQIVIGNYTVTSVGGAVSWSTVSDGRAKKNIRADVPGLDFINRLQPVTYNLDLSAIDELTKSDESKINAFRDSLSRVRSPEEKEIEAKARANKEKIVETGFVAQDVEKAAKSIGYDFSGVDVDELGIYELRYSEFVVPLVKAVQELSEKNDRLQGIVDALTKRIEKLENAPAAIFRSVTEGNTTTNLLNTAVEQCKLYQNAPNPFKEKTEIRYYLTPEVPKADIYIFNLQGDLLKKFPATHLGVVEITHLHLHAGMYIYTLVVDGQPVDSKRMILTK